MSAKLIGAKGLFTRFRAVERAPAGMMRTLGLTAVANQKELAPVLTGNLRRTIHLASSSNTEAVTVASARYAPAVEKGSRPHIIRPRRRKVLKFSAGGRVVFTKIVRHPGSKPQPFMLPGAKKAVEETAGLKPIIDAWNSAA